MPALLLTRPRAEQVSTQDFLLGFAILQALPGPNFNFGAYLGALSLPNSPFSGALLGFVGIFTPGLLLKFALLPTYSKFRKNEIVRSALRGLNASASGLIYVAVYRLWKVGLLTQGASKSLETEAYWIVLTAAAFVASDSLSLPPYLIVICGAVFGLFYGLAAGAP